MVLQIVPTYPEETLLESIHTQQSQDKEIVVNYFFANTVTSSSLLTLLHKHCYKVFVRTQQSQDKEIVVNYFVANCC